jgi:hypothetical protein
MAIFRGTQIRGQQIVDRTIAGEQILQNALSDEHIASNAAISETKLAINWHSHTEALEDRKVVDFVQVNGAVASGDGIDLEAILPAIKGIAAATSTDSIEGILVDAPKNIAPMRDSVSGEPLVAEIGGVDYEVIARVEFNSGKYELKFYTASAADGKEVAYTLPNPVTVDLQYARRFNLKNVDEMFASNEKFVHGAADVTASLDLQQLAQDIYGASWKLDRDGSKNLTISLQDQINQEQLRASTAETALTNALNAESTNRTNADTTLQNNIDAEKTRATTAEATLTNDLATEVTRAKNAETDLTNDLAAEATARQTADKKIVDDLASNLEGNGASLVGIYPINGLTATNVQAALVELKVGASDALVAYKEAVASTESGKGASLVGVDATKGLNGATVEAVLENHEGRLDTLEGNDTVTGSVDNKIKVQVIDIMTSTEAGKGASQLAVEAGSGLNGANVQAVLEDHELRVDAIEATIGGAKDRAESANKYFAAATFATLDERLESSEGIVDSNLKRVDDRDKADRTRTASANAYFSAEEKATVGARIADVETLADATAQEVKIARGSKATLDERLDVSVREDGFLVEDNKLHRHKKYTLTLVTAQSIVNLPTGEYFNVNAPGGSGSVAIDPINVYVNGILQANGINFTEVKDATEATKGLGVDFGTEQLVAGDVVILEWVLNNHN